MSTIATPPSNATVQASPSTWRMLWSNSLVKAGIFIVAALSICAIFADGLSGKDPYKQFATGLDADGMPTGPSREFWLGTDNLGRDVFSRLLHGTRVSLLVGAVAMIAALMVGVLIGLLSGYYGGWVDTVLMRFTDVMLALPPLLLAIALAGLMNGKEIINWPLRITLEQGLISVCFVIGAVSWTGIARVVRSQVLSLKERTFVEAARAIGSSNARIMWRHILPNALPAIIVLATMSIAGTILFEAGLSYLSLGVPPPAPSWGNMINDGQPYLINAPWIAVPPGIAIVLAVLGFNLLGQGLQDVLDPYHPKV